jgi:hypothetical protein
MIIESPEAELRSVIARITQTNPMYLPSTLLQLMREIDPELTAKFLQARNKYMKNKQNKSSNNNTVREESATRPTANDSKDIPRQYSDQRNVNFTDTGDYADTVSHENAPEDDDDDNESLVSMVREHYAMLMRLHPGTNTDDGSTRRINNHVTIRGDYQRAVRAALALSADGKHSTVSDGGADTWILGNGWRILAKTRRSTNVVGFDSNYAKKRNLPIVVGCAVTTDIKGRDILLVVFEGVANIDSPVSLLGEFQTREAGNIVDSVATSHHHWDGMPGNQGMKLRVPFADNTLKETIVPFHIQQALMVFHHRPPTDEELTTLPRFLMTPRDPWIPLGHVSSNKDIIPCVDPTQIAYLAVSDIIRQACPAHATVCPPSFPDPVEKGGDAILDNDILDNDNKDLLDNDILDNDNKDGAYDTDSSVSTKTDNGETGYISDLAKFEEPSLETDRTTYDTTTVAHANTTSIRDPTIPTSVTVNELPFLDAQERMHDDDAYFYDPSDNLSPAARLGRAFHLSVDYTFFIRDHHVDTFLAQLHDDELYGYNEPFDTYAYGMRIAATLPNAERLKPFLGY